MICDLVTLTLGTGPAPAGREIFVLEHRQMTRTLGAGAVVLEYGSAPTSETDRRWHSTVRAEVAASLVDLPVSSMAWRATYNLACTMSMMHELRIDLDRPLRRRLHADDALAAALRLLQQLPMSAQLAERLKDDPSLKEVRTSAAAEFERIVQWTDTDHAPATDHADQRGAPDAVAAAVAAASTSGRAAGRGASASPKLRARVSSKR